MDLLNHLHDVYAQDEFGAPVLTVAIKKAYERIYREFRAQRATLDGLLKTLDTCVASALTDTPGNPMLDQISLFVEVIFPQNVGKIGFDNGKYTTLSLHECMPAYTAYMSAKKWAALIAGATNGIDDAAADNESQLIDRTQVLHFVNRYGDRALAAVCKRDDLTACTPHARDEITARVPALVLLEDAIETYLANKYAACANPDAISVFWSNKSNFTVNGKEITYVASCANKQYKHYTHDKIVYIFYISEIGPCVISV